MHTLAFVKQADISDEIFDFRRRAVSIRASFPRVLFPEILGFTLVVLPKLPSLPEQFFPDGGEAKLPRFFQGENALNAKQEITQVVSTIVKSYHH